MRVSIILIFLTTFSVTFQECQNCAGTVKFNCNNIFYPKTTREIQQLIKENRYVKPIGALHSYSNIAESNFTIISTQFLDKIINLDYENLTVTVGGGIIVANLNKFLDKNGFATEQMIISMNMSVAGGIATGSHGSGDSLGSMGTSVLGIKMVTGKGEVVNITRETHPDVFDGIFYAN